MQNLNKTLKQLLIVPTILICFICMANSAFAQTSSSNLPSKDVPDNMLHNRAAIEVSERYLGVWGDELSSLSTTDANYQKVLSKFTYLYTLNNILQNNRNVNTTGNMFQTTSLLKNIEVANTIDFEYAVSEAQKLLNKKNNPQYKEK